MPTRDLSEENQGRLRLTLDFCRGVGRVTPRLEFSGNVRTLQPDAKVTSICLDVHLLLGNELLGTGAVSQPGVVVTSSESPISVQVPLSHQAIAYIEEAFRDARLTLTLQFGGMLWVEGGRANA